MSTTSDSARAALSGAGGHHTAKGASAWTGRGTGDGGSWLQLAGVAAAGFAAGMAVLAGRKVGMQLTSAFAGDWFRQLKIEHRMATALFELGLRTNEHEVGKRTAILAHLAYALVKHDMQETNVIYPAMRDAGENGEAKKLAAEHFDIKTYLHDLARMRKDDPQWIKVWSAFYKLIKHHVREEEEEVFPALHQGLSRRENWRLTAAMNREGIKVA